MRAGISGAAGGVGSGAGMPEAANSTMQPVYDWTSERASGWLSSTFGERGVGSQRAWQG